MDFTKYYEKYFLINLKDYPNIGVDLEITKILFFFFVGLIVATVAINYLRSTMYTVVKALMRREASSEAAAFTLGELGLDSTRVRRALRGGTQLSRIVGRVGESKYTYEEYKSLAKKKGFSDEIINFDEARFYIRPEQKLRAEKIYMSGASSVLHTVLFSVLLVAIFICLMLLLPEILSFVNKLLG